MAKKKLKKALMAAVPLAALAMMGRKGRAFTNADARKLMTQNNAMRNSLLNSPFGGMMTADDMAKDQMFLDAAAKKGGRIMKTKNGGRAVRTKGFSKTKKKQANKMRKK